MHACLLISVVTEVETSEAGTEIVFTLKNGPYSG
jgi:hypothetical protein